MAVHRWTILCERAIVDRFSNNLTIVSVVETFEFRMQRIGESAPDQAPPVLQVDFAVVSMWERSEPDKEETGVLRVRVTAPSGTVLIKDAQQKLELVGNKTRARSILNCRGVPLAENGNYEVRVQRQLPTNKWKTEGTVVVPVKIEIDTGMPEQGSIGRGAFLKS